MSIEQTNEINVNLRPTLIIGLGGSGLKIAVNLKARLEEQFGTNGNYQKAIRFLCFDTANEEFKAPYPNQPERRAILVPDREYIRISDVPLHNLTQNRDENPAISAILPEMLYSTQIDQGAQQVRRLGRIAWIYHYQTIRNALERNLEDLRSVGSMGNLGKSSDERYNISINDRRRLRVFICASICGGTGSGTFIDTAYLIRYLAPKYGISPSGVDIVGVFLLPECFPQIQTTGGGRIRANAYAALLDLEHYNQATSVNTPIYSVRMPGGDLVESQSIPYSLVYLVQRSSKEGAIPYNQVPSVLADALYTMVATPMGEKLDATLDNVRPTLTNYFQGYRAFYSAIGFAQVIYPERWQRQQYIKHLRTEIINKYLIGGTAGINKTQTNTWLDDFDRQVENNLIEHVSKDELTTIGLGFRRFRSSVTDSDDAISELQQLYRESLRRFDSNIRGQILANTEKTYIHIKEKLINEAHIFLNNSLHQSYGLAWVEEWLSERHSIIQDKLDEDFTLLSINDTYNSLLRDIDASSKLPILGKYERLKKLQEATSTLASLFEHAHENIITEQKRTIYYRLRDDIENLRRQYHDALTYFKRLADQQDDSSEISEYNKVTEPIIPISALEEIINDLLDNIRTVDNGIQGITDLNEQLTLSDMLIPNKRSQIVATLTRFSQGMYDNNNKRTTSIRLLERILNTPEKIDHITNRAQPLLNYGEAALRSFPPRQIKVIGAASQEDAENLGEKGLGGREDINSAGTDNPASVMLLVTHHGIPIHVVSQFHEYRQQYMQLLNEPNAIFHLDSDRENEPYDPGSSYFINLRDYEAYIARMLAYGWLSKVENEFLIESGFAEVLKKILTDRITTLTNHAKNSNTSVDLNKIKKDHALQIVSELELFLKGFNDSSYIIKQYENLTNEVIIPVNNLASMLDVLYGGRSREIPQWIIMAFEQYERTFFNDSNQNTSSNGHKQEHLISEFLKSRNYQPYKNGPNDNQMLLSQPGQPSHQLERRMCDILHIYLRYQRRQWYQDRWWGYRHYEDADNEQNNEQSDNGISK